MADRIVIYMGAPQKSALDWDSSQLLSEFQHPIAQFAGLSPALVSGSDPGQSPAAPSPSPSSHAVWRSLSLENADLHTGFSQQYAAEFFTSSFHKDNDNNNGGDATVDDISQFYEESYVAYQQLPPTSQLIAVEESQFTVTTTSSFSTDNNTSFISNASIKQPLLTTNAGSHLSDLQDLPSAAHLTSIQPQTMTCNLIVGMISLPPPRSIKTRWGSSHRLVEALVGDDTRAGFSITFWLPPPGNEAADALASTLAALRPADIVLLQNVALNVFSKRVYGYSLRRGLTQAHLLYRTKLDAEDAEGYYTATDLRLAESDIAVHPQLGKTRRVRDWVVRFVGHGDQGEAEPLGGAKGKGKDKSRSARLWDVMPSVNDTQ
ncbi:hypothetical protein QBC34DRAFT_173421 [Podospora aff. communis PSN243]|uniref:Endonuclease/exonuclease/phosphatase domain-containing protein n=1 Tax=Podospora aff. communis PSN243 TaxID=3040156 RepID=A0AAV9H1V2_9PEZI|nr:hypothetical protein QBC34DRAFT_173421 [Podospora aff. communis PSN243]